MVDNTINFNDEQLLRYSRQIMLPQFGVEGQQRLHNSNVAIIGLGGLGSPAAMYLAAAGVGNLTLVDFDLVDSSNLQRQIVHSVDSIGTGKVASAKTSLHALNPDTSITSIDRKLSIDELEKLFSSVDCVIDATDNFSTRFQINRACITKQIPLVSAAAIRFEGQISVFDSRDEQSACYACLYGEQGEDTTNCSDNGILAPVVGILGSMQALETIKLLTRIGETLHNRLLIFDALGMQWRTLKLTRDPHCPVCG